MTDFWLNHFNVYLRKNEQMPYYLVSYERDVIRPRALGKFEDLLEADGAQPGDADLPRQRGEHRPGFAAPRSAPDAPAATTTRRSARD